MIIYILFLVISIFLAYFLGTKKQYELKVKKEQEIEKENFNLKQNNNKLKEQINNEKLSLEKAQNKMIALLDDYRNKKRTLENELKEYYKLKEDEMINSFNQKEEEMQNQFKDKFNECLLQFNEKNTLLQCDISKVHEDLEQLKSKRKALIDAMTREEQIKEQQDFYKIKISKEDLSDIELLEKIKEQLRKPEVLSKVIWTTFIQKPTNELINNVVGTQTVCGIYKITNLLDNKSYIGQSVDISNRFKQHIKAGLGIEGSNNKFYTAMKKNGVWNFTFEILEICDRKDLNEREKFYINTYESNVFGYNTTSGGS